MRKLLLVLVLLLAITPIATEAHVIRSHSTRAFLQDQNAVVRTRWQTPLPRDTWRYFPTYSKYDLLRWREQAQATKIDPEIISTPRPTYLSAVFCSFEGSRIGEYLTQDEVDNRCCTCDDGWQCEFSHLARREEGRTCASN